MADHTPGLVSGGHGGPTHPISTAFSSAFLAFETNLNVSCELACGFYSKRSIFASVPVLNQMDFSKTIKQAHKLTM